MEVMSRRLAYGPDITLTDRQNIAQVGAGDHALGKIGVGLGRQ